MLKKLNYCLNILMGSCCGVFLGHSAYVFWDHKTHPGLYAMCSTPWYTSIQVYGAATAVVLLVGIAVKFFIRKKL